MDSQMIEEDWKDFVFKTDSPWCWWCGRVPWERPPNWYAPWLLERAHICNKPRARDRRAAILLCSMCHKKSHGEVFGIEVDPEQLPAPTAAQMIMLKARFDPDYYDREFISRHIIGRLQTEGFTKIPKEVLRAYHDRQKV